MDPNETDLSELKNVNYELFLVAITLLSIANIFFVRLATTEAQRGVVWLVDLSFCLLFMGDFIYRLFSAKSKTSYFFRQYGWLDLLGSLPIPFIRFVRLVRAGRTVRMLRHYGVKNMGRELGQDIAGSTLLSVAFLGILVMEFGSYFILGAEAGAENANIRTPSDALWWSVVTIATVGYGDRYPVTDQGRIIGTFVILTGVGLFGAFTGFLANSFINRRRRRNRFGLHAAAYSDPLDEIREMLEEQGQRLANIEKRLPPLPPGESTANDE